MTTRSEGITGGNSILAYLLHARVTEAQKQPLLSNTRTQQKKNGVMQPVSRQRFGKHDPTRNNREGCVSYVVCATQQYSTAFSVRWSVRRLYNASPLVASSVESGENWTGSLVSCH
jgi:hypothetical protein